MVLTIQLNDQFGRGAVEIDNEARNGLLPVELYAAQLFTS